MCLNFSVYFGFTSDQVSAHAKPRNVECFKRDQRGKSYDAEQMSSFLYPYMRKR